MRPLVRAQVERSTVRAVIAVAAVVAAWLAWSPGTRFGLAGAYGGWRYAGDRLFDVGLVPMAVGAALGAAALRERRVDEHLHLAGVPRPRLVGAVAAGGAAVALLVAVAFAVGAGVGGGARAVAVGGSWWAGPGASGGPVTDALVDGRLALGAALVGALAALVGWVVRGEGRAVALAVVLAAGELPELSALLGRLPITVDLLAASPLGSVRVVTLGDRGLAAPGYARPGAPFAFVVVLVGWLALLVAWALPRPRRGRGSSTSLPPVAPAPGVAERVTGHRLGLGDGAALGRVGPARVGFVVMVVALTVVFGAVVPDRAAQALPWRWQRAWRIAEQQGWSSPQTVDRLVRGLRSDPPGAPAEVLGAPDAVAPTVLESIPRASRVDRQPVATMAGPDSVLVRLHFDQPIVSGGAALSDYLVRFVLRSDTDHHWRIVGAEGPVAEVGASLAPGPGS